MIAPSQNNWLGAGVNPPSWLGASASPISGELSVVNLRFVNRFRGPGETRLAKLAPPIWLREGVGAFSKAR
jgi:hypothetical protein